RARPWSRRRPARSLHLRHHARLVALEDGQRRSGHGGSRTLQRGRTARGRGDMSARFDEIRSEITANGEGSRAAGNPRLALVGALWELKAQLGYDTVDPDRERHLREHLAATSSGPLSTHGVERLVTTLLDLTKSELDA